MHWIIRNAVIEHLKGYHFRKSLDLGCGTGDIADVLKEHTDYLIGVDKDEDALKIARERGFYDELHVADIREFSLDDVDSIFMFDSIEHCPKECGYKLLRKIGDRFIMITTPWWNFPFISNPDHKCTWSATELEGLGFETHGYSFFPDIGMCVSYGGIILAVREVSSCHDK